jgi:hypothetical protein
LLICAFGARFPLAQPQLIFASFTCKNGFSARAVPAGVDRLRFNQQKYKTFLPVYIL